jgi:hypothetical protein
MSVVRGNDSGPIKLDLDDFTAAKCVTGSSQIEGLFSASLCLSVVVGKSAAHLVIGPMFEGIIAA